MGEGSGLSSASLVPPASPRNGHSRGGRGFSHGLAYCQVWGDNHQERDARGGEGEWKLGDVFRLCFLETPVAVLGGRRTGVQLGGGLNGEGSVAVTVSGRHKEPQGCLLPTGDRTSEMRAGVRPVPSGGRAEARGDQGKSAGSGHPTERSPVNSPPPSPCISSQPRRIHCHPSVF